MEFKALIEQRRSVRAYRETAITREALEGILTAARRAPSWKNMQASRCYAVVTQEKLAEVRAALPSFNQNSSKNAALIVTTFVKGQVGHTNGAPDNELGDMWGAYDLGLHDAYLILAAKDAGYDTLIMGIRDADALRQALAIPEEEQVVSVIAVGMAAQEPALKPRKPLEEVARFC